jgi:hypothetical protein
MIEFPISGVVWLAVLGVVIWRRSWLLVALVVSAVFHTAAVVNVASGGSMSPVSVYYVSASLTTLYLALNLGQGRGRILLPRGLRPTIAFFAAFLFYCAVSLTLPLGFIDVPVYAPGLGYSEGLIRLVPARLSFSMVAQLAFLAVNFMLIVLLVSARRIEHVADAMIRGTMISAVVVVGLCLWQLLHRLLGIYFPSDLIYTSHGWALHAVKSIAGVPRINGPFQEPSFLAAYLVSALAFMLRAWSGLREWQYGALSIGLLFSLLLTTSTTAYLSLGVLLMIVVITQVVIPGLKGRGVPASGVYLAVFGLVSSVIVLLLLSVSGSQGVLDAVLFGKSETSSFSERVASDYRAIGILLETFGLGIGLGANLPSSFGAHLLSNVGVVGTLLFFGFVLTLTATALHCASKLVAGQHSVWLSAAVYGLWAHLIARLIAVPTTSFAVLWVWVALVAVLAAAALRRGVGVSSATNGRSRRAIQLNPTGVLQRIEPLAGREGQDRR